jgi:AcrR family transcriptional regulator
MIVAQETRKEVIIKEAARLFRAKGFKATTMRDLAEAVGVEAASLYNHIRNKQEILQHICFQLAEAHKTSLEKIGPLKASPIDKIEALLHAHLSVNTTMPEIAAVAQEEWKHLDKPARYRFSTDRKAYEDTLMQWILEAMNRSQIPPMNPRIVLYTLISALEWPHQWYRQEGEITAEEVENAIIALIMHGLKK